MAIPKKNLLLTGRIFFASSALLFAGMLYYGFGALSYKDNTIETSGIIVGFTQADKAAGEPDYHPLIEYTDTKGTTYRMNPEVAMNSEVMQFIKAKESGSGSTETPVVKIRYSKACPKEASLAGSFLDIWGAAIAYGVLALVFSITGTALMQAGEPGEQKK